MDRFDRIFDLHKLLSASRHPVSRKRIEQELECSRATAKRIIEAMRLYLNAPIRYDRERNGYCYDHSEGQMYELPGVWFNASELQALLSMQQLLTSVQPGLLERQLAPLRERIGQLLKAQHAGGDEIGKRISIVSAAARPVGQFFQLTANALAGRKRLRLDYYKRGDDSVSCRIVSPQRMIHYRDNWYLDAYCHLRRGMRTFALDAITSAEELEQAARELPPEDIEAYHSSAYGIFSGSAKDTAILVFEQQRARWVAAEQWHPQQRSRWLEDGRYELRIPYRHSAELVMDILKYGPDVEVMAPDSLRLEVSERLAAALRRYP